MMKKLTYRQKEFLSQFLDVYQELGKPIHYVTLSERLGIGKVTAYEMLRTLEAHGMVKAEYQLSQSDHGPGRSPVCFLPTREAGILLNRIAGESLGKQDWLTFKRRILSQIEAGRTSGKEALLDEILQHIQDRKPPQLFITEMITAIILMLDNLKESQEIKDLLMRLEQIGLPQKVGLGVLSGISMFLSTIDRTNRKYSSVLVSQVKRFEDVLAQLNDESHEQISTFTREIIHLVLA